MYPSFRNRCRSSTVTTRRPGAFTWRSIAYSVVAPPSGPGEDTRNIPFPRPSTFCVMSNCSAFSPMESRGMPARSSGRIFTITSGPESPRTKLARHAVTPAGVSSEKTFSERPEGFSDAAARSRKVSRMASLRFSGVENKSIGLPSAPRPSMARSFPSG